MSETLQHYEGLLEQSLDTFAGAIRNAMKLSNESASLISFVKSRHKIVSVIKQLEETNPDLAEKKRNALMKLFGVDFFERETIISGKENPDGSILHTQQDQKSQLNK